MYPLYPLFSLTHTLTFRALLSEIEKKIQETFILSYKYLVSFMLSIHVHTSIHRELYLFIEKSIFIFYNRDIYHDIYPGLIHVPFILIKYM